MRLNYIRLDQIRLCISIYVDKFERLDRYADKEKKEKRGKRKDKNIDRKIDRQIYITYYRLWLQIDQHSSLIMNHRLQFKDHRLQIDNRSQTIKYTFIDAIDYIGRQLIFYNFSQNSEFLIIYNGEKGHLS